MSERAALVAAILAEPESDAPRLRCADWFEAEGDPASVARAQFIRTQIARAKLSPTDSLQGELQARELRLLKTYGAAWCQSHFAFRKVRFRRGFIEYVHLHLQHFLHHRRQLFALEPVRDVRLTGWHRASDQLVRHVAACEEWKHVQTLRIHHQGPHKSPRSNLVLLLESAHLSALAHLHVPMLEFDAAARRRFEQLPLLRQIESVCIPSLDNYPLEPGEWFSDGGTDAAARWSNLRSVTLPYYLTIDLLREFTAMPWWDHLSSLALTLPWDIPECLDILRDRMPASLRELTVALGPSEVIDADSFFARLAQTPLRRLQLDNFSFKVSSICALFSQGTRCRLREVSLYGDSTTDHVRTIAQSPAASELLNIKIDDWSFQAEAARLLFASPHLRSVVSLDLEGTRIGSEGVAALARAKGWESLRSLRLSDGVTTAGFEELAASPNLRNLTHLSVGGRSRDSEPLIISSRAANNLAALPHLARLNLVAKACEPEAAAVLARSDSIAWQSLNIGDDDRFDIAAYRAQRSPQVTPPVDDTFDDD